jgi:hypothetical protein
MSNRSREVFHDPIVTPADTGLPERFFDRFVFNMHGTDGTVPSIVFGHGLYPGRDIVDGFAIVSTASEQRNLRWSSELSATDWASCGPFAFEVVEPNATWHLVLGENPSGMSFDVTWRVRTPAWWGDVDVTNASGETTSFAHLFQSGYVDGSLTIDGDTERIERWYSQRDRSRGVRTMSGGQGLHLWCQAQFPDRSIGFLLVERRDGGRVLLEGAVMHTEGTLDAIVDVRHGLVVDDQLDLQSGRVRVSTESGRMYDLTADMSARGGYLAGGGYGGHHGQGRGRDHVESDVYPLDGSVTPRTLDSSLTDRLAVFDWNGTRGSGIFEFALSRSTSYSYRPTLV